MTAKLDTEIAALRGELAERDRIIRRLNSLLAVAGVVVRSRPVMFPNRGELQALIAQVGKVYPSLIDADAGFISRVANALTWLAFMHRPAAPDVNYSLSHWADEARDWLAKQAWPNETDSRAVLVAAIADRLEYADPELGHYNWQPTIGVSVYGIGKPYSGAWRETLRSGIAKPYLIDRQVVGTRRVTFEQVVGGGR
jgi:hypothetical protein